MKPVRRSLFAAALAVLAAIPAPVAGAKTWTPRLAYFSFQGGGDARLFSMLSDGTGKRRAGTGFPPSYVGQWSVPAGRAVYFHQFPSGNTDIYTVRREGDDRMRLTKTPNAEWQPSWSRDGKRIAFARFMGSSWDVFIMKWDGTHVRRVTTTGEDEFFPIWKPDGTRLAFSRKIAEDQFDIFTINTNGTDEQRVTNDGSSFFNFVGGWSPGNTKLVYWQFDGADSAINTIDTDGTDPLTLVPGPGLNEYPVWLPNGQIAYSSDADGDFEVWVMESDGTDQTQLTHNGVPDFTGFID